MDLETSTNKIAGSIDWFLKEFSLIDREEFGIAKYARKDGITNFEAIQTALISASKENWRFLDSKNFETEELEDLINAYVNYHACVPYIGGTPLKSQEPIGCLEGEVEDTLTKNMVYSKLAYWSNGAIYYIEERNTDKFMYLLAVDKKTAELYNYPESKKDQSE